MIEKQVRNILIMLSAQFLYGMGLNLIGEDPKSNFLRILSVILLVLHIVTAIGIVATGYLIARGTATASPGIRNKARLGLVSVSLAFLGGVLTVSVQGLEEVFSFVMAVGFIGGMTFFGITSTELARTSKA